MALNEEQREIALEKWREVHGFEAVQMQDQLFEVIARFLAALPDDVHCEKCGQVPQGQSGIYECSKCGLPLVHDDLPASEQKPIAWATTNEDGDYAMLFFDQQEARNYSGDDEPIGLVPVSSSAPQPDYKAQREAELYRWLRDHNKSWSWNPSQYNKEIISGFAAFNTGYLGFEFEVAIDAAIASVKGG